MIGDCLLFFVSFFFFNISLSFASARKRKKVSVCFVRFSSKMKEHCREIRKQKLGEGHPCCRLLLYEFKSLYQTFVYIFQLLLFTPQLLLLQPPNFCQEAVKVTAEECMLPSCQLSKGKLSLVYLSNGCLWIGM